MDTGSTDDTIAIARRRGCRVEMVSDQFDSVLDRRGPPRSSERFAKGGDGPLVAAGQRLFHFGDARQHAGSWRPTTSCSSSTPAMKYRHWTWTRSIGGSIRGASARSNTTSCTATFDCASRASTTAGGTTGKVAFTSTSARPCERTLRRRRGFAATRRSSWSAIIRANKARNYLAGLALQVLECPEKPRWWHYLGRELFYHRWYESAIAALDAHANDGKRLAGRAFAEPVFRGRKPRGAGTHRARRRRATVAPSRLDPTRREPLLRLAIDLLPIGPSSTPRRSGRASRSRFLARTPYPELEANYTWIPHSAPVLELVLVGPARRGARALGRIPVSRA